MSTIRTWTHRIAAASIFMVPQLALAGDPGSASVLVRPLSSTPVPSLGSYGLIALGLLLAVVAVRVIRAHEGMGNILGVAILATGMAAGGFGIEKAWASGIVTIDGDICNHGGWLDFNPYTYEELSNYCPGDVQVIDFRSQCPLNFGSEVCDEGDILNGYSGSGKPDYCELPECDN
jgi:hypothetical protein